METQKKKTNALLAMVGVSFVNGVASGFIEDGSALFWIVFAAVTVILELFILQWFINDARERDYPLPPLAYVMFFALTPIMVAIYFVETRGRAAWRPIALALLFALVLWGLSALGLLCVETGIALRQK